MARRLDRSMAVDPRLPVLARKHHKRSHCLPLQRIWQRSSRHNVTDHSLGRTVEYVLVGELLSCRAICSSIRDEQGRKSRTPERTSREVHDQEGYAGGKHWQGNWRGGSASQCPEEREDNKTGP